MPSIGDHYRPRGDDGPVYRVVGTGDEAVLLRVTDERGRRASTGELRRVSSERLDEEFAPTEDPGAGLGPVTSVRNALSGLYWSVRGLL